MRKIIITICGFMAISLSIISCSGVPIDGYRAMGNLYKGMPLTDFIYQESDEDFLDGLYEDYKEEEDDKENNYSSYKEYSMELFNVTPKVIYEYTDIEGAEKISIIYYNWPMVLVQLRQFYYTGILAFENEKLLYWGFIEDFKKSKDKKIRNIGDRVVTEYFNNK